MCDHRSPRLSALAFSRRRHHPRLRRLQCSACAWLLGYWAGGRADGSPAGGIQRAHDRGCPAVSTCRRCNSAGSAPRRRDNTASVRPCAVFARSTERLDRASAFFVTAEQWWARTTVLSIKSADRSRLTRSPRVPSKTSKTPCSTHRR